MVRESHPSLTEIGAVGGAAQGALRRGASRSDTGVMARFTMAVPVRALAVGLAVGGVAIGQPAQTIGYGDPTDDETPLTRLVDTSGVGFEAVLGDISEPIAAMAFSAHPAEDTLALVTEAEDGTLRVRMRVDGAWGGDATVTADASGGSARGFGAAHEQATGRLMIAYRKAGQNQIYFRTHDGSLSSESSVDLGFSGAPDRVLLVARPGVDELLLAASGNNSIRAAVWDGSAFGSVQTIEGSFTGTAAAWDAAALPQSAGWMIGWARATDSSLRSRRFSSGAWSLTATGPSAGGPIGAVQMASDPAGSELAVLMQRDSNGSIHAARHDNTAWSSATQIDGGARDEAFDIEYEGSAGALVAAWAEDGSDRVRFRRWDGVSWGAETQSNALTGNVVEVLATALDAEAAVVLAARAESKIVVYTENGTVSLGATSVDGIVASNLPNFGFPANPGASHGATDYSYGNNQTVTLAPGSYRTLSVGNNFTLNLSAGTYRFKESVSNKSSTHFVCDTSGGDVTIIFADGDLQVGNQFEVSRSGSGVVLLHVSDGDFVAGHSASIEAMIAVHKGEISLGNTPAVVGRLFASDDITAGMGVGSITQPSWDIPGESGTNAQEAWAVVVDSGSASSPIQLTADSWVRTTTLPLAISRMVGPRAIRILRWTETPAFED